MSKLQELINKLCPNGVEFKPLGEVCEIKRGVRVVKQELEEFGDIPVFQNSLKPLGYYKLSNFKGFTSFVIGAGAAGEIGFSEKPFWAADDCFVIISNYLNDKYIFYCLQNNQLHLKRQVRKASIPRLSRVSIEKFMIPVPPIEVQEEIVRILDSFSDYAAELQAELQARKQQYEYYRNLLLTFNPSAYGCGTDDEQKDGVTTWEGHNYKIEWKKLGEIGTFIRGKRFVRTDIMEQGVPCIHYGDMYTYYGLYTNNTPTFLKEEKAQKMRFAQKNDIVIVAAGENKDDLGNAVAWLGEKPAAVHDACFIFRSNLYPNYISHICRSHNYHKQIKMFANEAKICSVSGQDLQKVLIPVPEYELQIKIASILDRFETLVNDLTNGLPAEIAAVKDQYEYYRNKLLTFKKLSA